MTWVREQIMELYDLPESLREEWRRIWRDQDAVPGRLDRPHCLPGCDRLDGHDGRDIGACMRDGTVLYPWTRLNLPFGRNLPRSPVPPACYRSEYGFTVHIRGACKCR